MSENPIWFGYLEAGAKSTPVVLDQRLNTGKPDTVYLFNLARNSFLEYKREIVDAKLRELQDGEADLGTLKSAFNDARKEFRPRVSRAQTVAERGSATSQSSSDEPEEPLDELLTSSADADIDSDDEDDTDDDWDEDED